MTTRQVTCRIPVEQADALAKLAEQMSTPHVEASIADALRRVIKAGLDRIRELDDATERSLHTTITDWQSNANEDQA